MRYVVYTDTPTHGAKLLKYINDNIFKVAQNSS